MTTRIPPQLALAALLSACALPSEGPGDTQSPGPSDTAADVADSAELVVADTLGAGLSSSPGRALLLARETATLSLELPPSSREDLPLTAELPCEEFELDGPVEAGLRRWRARLPVRPGDFSRRRGPTGMEVQLGGQPLVYDRSDTSDTWHLNRRWLWVKTRDAAPPQDCVVVAPEAVERERARQLEVVGDVEELALHDLHHEGQTRTGLLLPAPASATWTVQLPERAALTLDARLLPPEVMQHASSDGAELVVELDAGRGFEEAGRAEVSSRWAPLRVDLSEWAGEVVALRLRTDPRRHARLDYVYVAEPAVFTPAAEPRRVVLIFVDTLRADRLGLHGYPRPTTPVLDAWAQDATVFTQARSIAPWTLPSVQAALTGQLPERFAESPQLPELLAGHGFQSVGVAFNANLAPAFGFGRGWSDYRYTAARTADETVDLALAALDRHADQDLLLMAHFLDTHLPYDEPGDLRQLWAGPHPEGLPARFTRSDLLELDPGSSELVQDYVSDRYDQALRNVDRELARLLEALDDDDIVVFFSDHGEELWDHGGVEHGHALWDEVVRVPFVVRAPGLAPGRSDLPVSLLDLTPTILDLLELEPLAGSPGMPVAEVPVDRPQPLGWLLYEDDTWGVVQEGEKWTAQLDEHGLFDLERDPGEAEDLARKPDFDPAPYQQALASALGTQLVDVWRLRFPRGRGGPDHQLLLRQPEGFAGMWFGYDPRGARRLEARVGDDEIVLLPEDRQFFPRVVYLEPNATETEGLELEVLRDGESRTLAPESARRRGRILRQRLDGVVYELAWDRVPRPLGDTVGRPEGDLDEALRALGYVE